MNTRDPVIERLAEFPPLEPSAELSTRIRAAAAARLCVRAVHPAWSLAIAASAMAYLGWAFSFASGLY